MTRFSYCLSHDRWSTWQPWAGTNRYQQKLRVCGALFLVPPLRQTDTSAPHTSPSFQSHLFVYGWLLARASVGRRPALHRVFHRKIELRLLPYRSLPPLLLPRRLGLHHRRGPTIFVHDGRWHELPWVTEPFSSVLVTSKPCSVDGRSATPGHLYCRVKGC